MKRAEEREKWKRDQLEQREAEKRKREERKRQNQLELERIREERERRIKEKEELKALEQHAPSLSDAVAEREASMYKRARETRPPENTDNLSSIQKIAWNAHDKIFGMAADIGQQRDNNPIPQTEEAFFSKAKQREALAEQQQEEFK